MEGSALGQTDEATLRSVDGRTDESTEGLSDGIINGSTVPPTVDGKLLGKIASIKDGHNDGPTGG